MQASTNHSADPTDFTPGEIRSYLSARGLNLRKQGKELRGPCPIHHGKRDSFAINPQTGLWQCHSECGRGGSLISLEMELSGKDFSPAREEVFRIVGRPKPNGKAGKHECCTYPYLDEDGILLSEVVRFEPKDFRQRRPDPNNKGEWIWDLKGVRRVLYRLGQLKDAELVLVAEGEKDVHGLERLGFVATCNPMGVGKWSDEYSDTLAGKDVVIFPDQDEPGLKHAEQVAKSLEGKARSVKVLQPLWQGKDVSDWIRNGADRAAIEKAIAEAKGQVVAFPDSPGVAERQTPGRIRRWAEIPTLDSLPTQNVEWVAEGIVPANGIVLWAGESGAYKTWISLLLTKAVNEGSEFLGRKTTPKPVLYLDRENPLGLIRERCELLGIQSSEDFRFWGGWESDPPPMIGDYRLLEIARTIKPVIVVDSFIRFHAADENSATEIAPVMGYIRDLANAGAVPVLVHHKPKAEGTLYRGSTDIKAGVDVAFAVTYDKQENLVTLQCFKNRFGEEARITIRPRLDEGIGFELASDPTLQKQHDEIGAVLRIVQGQPGISQTEMVKRAGLPRNRMLFILRRGEGRTWRTEDGPRNSLRYYPIAEDSSCLVVPTYSTKQLNNSNGAPGVIEGEL